MQNPVQSSSWQTKASCGNYRPPAGEAWPWDTSFARMPGNAQKIKDNLEAKAKEICAGCPVQAQCLAFGALNDQWSGVVEGIYGGLTPDERAAAVGMQIKLVAGLRHLVPLTAEEGELACHGAPRELRRSTQRPARATCGSTGRPSALRLKPAASQLIL